MVTPGKFATRYLITELVTVAKALYVDIPSLNVVTVAEKLLTPAIVDELDETVTPVSAIGEGSPVSKSGSSSLLNNLSHEKHNAIKVIPAIRKKSFFVKYDLSGLWEYDTFNTNICDLLQIQ